MTAWVSCRHGARLFDPALLRSLLGARVTPPEGLTLTPREAEVLSLMAEGLSNKLIAERLKISDHTAKFHAADSILNKARRRDAHRGRRAGCAARFVDVVMLVRVGAKAAHAALLPVRVGRCLADRAILNAATVA